MKEDEFAVKLIEKVHSRDDLLRTTSSLIRHLIAKASDGRFRDRELERLRDAKMRVLTEVIKVHAAILKDFELDEFEQRIIALEKRLEGK